MKSAEQTRCTRSSMSGLDWPKRWRHQDRSAGPSAVWSQRSRADQSPMQCWRSSSSPRPSLAMTSGLVTVTPSWRLAAGGSRRAPPAPGIDSAVAKVFGYPVTFPFANAGELAATHCRGRKHKIAISTKSTYVVLVAVCQVAIRLESC